MKKFFNKLKSYKKSDKKNIDVVDDGLTRAYTKVKDNSKDDLGKTKVFTDTKRVNSADEGNQLFNVPQKEDMRGGKAALLKDNSKRKHGFALSVILTTSKLAIIMVIIFVAVSFGSVFGLATAYLDTSPDLDISAIENQSVNSYLYDCNGNEICAFTGLENRDWADSDEIPQMMKEAIISIEDSRFYYHNGVDFKRLIGSFIQNLSSNSVQGGSTITQQLVKNQLLSPERSYKRKLQEAYLSMELEQHYSKDQILTAYLNSIPLGGTIYGVKAAAKQYFNKDLSELTLRECACLAGITQYPYKYSPRRVYYGSDDPEETAKRIKDLAFRTDTVLVQMFEQGYITREELEAAEADELVVVNKSAATSAYEMPHFVEYAVNEIIDDLIEERGIENTKINRSAIENELKTGGYNIYLTVDPSIQNTVQESLANYDNYPRLQGSNQYATVINGVETIQPQAAAVVMDHYTGQLRAIVGSRTEPTALKTTNRASDNRMPVGSSIKPLAVYGPAFELGAGLGTVVANIPAPINGWGDGKGYPEGGLTESSTGPVTIRYAIKQSLNNAAARVLADYVGVEKSTEYLIQLGVDPSHIESSLAGLSMGFSGISPIEMAGAYSCIANGGIYIEPISYTVVTDVSGQAIIDATEKQDKREVFSQATAYMLTVALEDAVEGGTGHRAKIPGMSTAGKTGTVSENRGMFFAGFTPYYTSTLWIGHDQYIKLDKNKAASSVTAPLFRDYMTKIHQGLSNKSFYTKSASEYGVTKKTVCAVSGKIPTALCPTTSDYFANEDGPTETCDMHTTIIVCAETGLAATEYCPSTTTSSGVVIPADSPYAFLSEELLSSLFPNYVNNPTLCTTHTKEWFDSQGGVSPTPTPPIDPETTPGTDKPESTN